MIAWQQTGGVPAGQVQVRSDPEGHYRACSVPAGIPLQAEARFLDGTSRQYTFRAAPGMPTEQDLELRSYATVARTPSGIAAEAPGSQFASGGGSWMRETTRR